MAISLTHAFTSLKSDGADPTFVQPSNWNAQHILTQSVSQKLLGRSSAGAGPTEEIGLDSSFSLSAQILGVLGATGSFTLSGSNTPTALASDVNDYNPPNMPTTVTLRIDGGAADRNITGMAGGADGRLMRIINIGATNNLILKNQNTSSQVQNRFLLGADITVTPGVTFVLQYDNASSVWRPYSTATLSSLLTTGGTMGGAFNWATAVTLPSAAIVNIGAAAGNYIIITGTTTITAFDSIAQGAERIVRFSAALTLTNNAVSLILPGGANITTAAGDTARFISDGSGNWRCLEYTIVARSPTAHVLKTGDTLSGALNWSTAVALASAATVNIGAAASNFVNVTGTTTITAFDSIAQGAERVIRFDGALTLTHNGTSLILPGAANITTAAGDVALFVSEGSGNWRCVNYQVSALSPAKAVAADIRAATDDTKKVTPKSIYDGAASVTLTDGATITPDFTTGLNFSVTLAGNRTLANPSAGMTPGRSGAIRVVQDATGSRTLAYGSQWKFNGGAPTLSTAANAVDVLWYYVFDSTTIYATLSKAHA